MTPLIEANRWKSAALDVVLGVVGLAFGWASLLYPFGRDQGLYYYVAREWVVRGAIPYRDVLDHKPPGIYLIYGLAVRLFGENLWGIRVFDFLCVALVGVVSAAIATPRGRAILPGLRGASIVVIAVLYYGVLDYWNTIQSELWYSMFGLAAVWAATRVERTARAEVLAGVLSGTAMLIKPPAIWFVFIAVAALVERVLATKEARPRRLSTGALRFTAGSLVVPVPVLVYFAAHHALGPMIDIVVGANRYYVEHERTFSSFGDALERIEVYLLLYTPIWIAFGAGLIVGAVRSHRAGDVENRRSFLLAIALLVGGFLAVYMQQKLYILHFTVMLPPATVAAATLLRWAHEKRSGRATSTYAWAFTGFAVLYTHAFFTDAPRSWWHLNVVSVKYVRHEISRDQFAANFTTPVLGFFYERSERVGLWLRDHTTPDDLVTVRGFQPEIYAVANRHHAGRFFWTTFITHPDRAYRRAEWLAEDLRDLREHPAKYVVAIEAVREGPDSVSYFLPLGYQVVTSFDGYTILERRP